MDTIKADPPFAPMTNLPGTSLWYVMQQFEPDDLLDYMLAVDDPMTPLAAESDIVGRVSQHWRVDPRNPVRMYTTPMDVSVLRMDRARPFPDWSAMNGVPRGRIMEHTIDSRQLGFSGRKLWVYTPPGYGTTDQEYPLLILNEGQWAVGPLQIPYIADALIKHQHMQPIVIAMEQSGAQADRVNDYVSNDKQYTHALLELLPYVQAQYRIDPTHLGIGGVGVGAIGAAHCALKNPAVFNGLIMISPPLGKGVAEDKLEQYAQRFQSAPVLPSRIFQSIGRYEIKARFYRPAQVLRQILEQRTNTAYKYVEIGSGHGLVAFKSIAPEALAWVFPGPAA
jgi:enterochelin esterase-like enzyme